MALAIVVHANAFGNRFVFDDKAVIENNPAIRSLREIPSLFRSGYYGPGRSHQQLYRPLTVATFSLNYAVGGLDTRGYTLVNILLHAGCTLALLFLLLSCGAALPVAGGAAALFAVHPAHVEAVTGFVGRAETLSTLLVLLACLLHRRAAAHRSIPARLLGPAAFFLALLAKESAIALLALVPLMDWLLPAAADTGRRLPLSARLTHDYPLYALAVVVAFALRFGAVGGLGIDLSAVNPLDNPLAALRRTTDGGLHGATPLQRWCTPLVLVHEYLRLLVWPARLSADYSFNQIPLANGFGDGRVLTGLAEVTAAAAGLFLLRRRLPVAAFGLGWLGATYALVANVLFLLGTIFAERLIYLPSVGFLAAAAALLHHAAAALRPGVRSAAWTLTLLALIAPAAARTWIQNRVWRDDRALWEEAVKAAPGSAKAHYGLGAALSSAVRQARDETGGGSADILAGDAVRHLREAIRIYPPASEPYNALANLLLESGSPDEAVSLYRRATVLSPGYYMAHANLGYALLLQGRQFQATSDARPQSGDAGRLVSRAQSAFDEAEQEMAEGLRLNPDYAQGHVNLGLFLWDKQGERRRAAEHLRRALALRPDLPERRSLETLLMQAP